MYIYIIYVNVRKCIAHMCAQATYVRVCTIMQIVLYVYY